MPSTGRKVSEITKEKIRLHSLPKAGIPILQLDMLKSIINTFPTLKAAARHLRQTSNYPKAAAQRSELPARSLTE